MSAGCLSCLVAVMSLAQDPAVDSSDNWIHWDAEYSVIVKGSIGVSSRKFDRTFHLVVRESPSSEVGISGEPGKERIKIEPGVSFEQRSGFFWGGLSRPNDPPGRFPKFQLEIVGRKTCLLREINPSDSEIREGVTFVKLVEVELPQECS